MVDSPESRLLAPSRWRSAAAWAASTALPGADAGPPTVAAGVAAGAGAGAAVELSPWAQEE